MYKKNKVLIETYIKRNLTCPVLIDRWLWSEGAAQLKLEEGLGIGGFGYPVSTKYNYRKNSKIWDTSNNCHNCPKNRKV